jgi:hypothetical protein
LYPPHRFHLHPPSLSFSSTTLTLLQNTKLSYPSLSLHVMIMSWHRVQHTPSNQDCLSSLHSHDFKLTPECSFIFRSASLHDRPPSASSPCELKGKVPLSHSHSCELTNWWIESQHPMHRPLTASKYSSKLAWLWPTSSLAYGLQVHLQTHSNVACKFARSRLPSAFLQTFSIMASKCISKLVWLQPPQVHLQTPSITISECISKFTRSWPPSVSPNRLQYRLQVDLQSHSITALECISQITRSSFAGVPRLSLTRHLQPIQLYCV